MDIRQEEEMLLISTTDSSLKSIDGLSPSTTMDEEFGEETSEQQALRNPLVLKEIMKRSTLKNLKNFRLVNKAWLQDATKELLKRDCLELHIFESNSLPHDQDNDKSVNWTPFHQRHTSLQSVNDSLTHSLYFPCSTFRLGDGCMSCPDVQNFFSTLGHSIKTLHLQDRANVTPKEVFQRILMDQAPFVETLSIDGFEYDWKESDQLILPWLTCLKLGPLKKNHKDCETIKKILVGAINLKVAVNFQLDSNLSLFVETGKVDTIKEVDGIEHMLNLEALSRFSLAGPKLETFKFFSLWTERIPLDRRSLFKNVYNQILTSSRQSLKNLVMELELTDFVPTMTIPMLPNLKTLSLYNLRSFQSSNLTSRCLDSRNFPSLETLCIHFYSVNSVLQCTEQFPSVTCLEIYHSCSRQLLAKLHECCPNIKKLKVAALVYEKYHLIPEICSHWPGLEELQFDTRGEVPKWDEALTGFTEETCHLLSKQELKMDQDLDKLRIRPWIGKITGLRRLKICILLQKKWSTYDHTITTINLTNISGLFVFKLMPDLAVTISVDDKTCKKNIGIGRELASVSPYATVWYRKCKK